MPVAALFLGFAVACSNEPEPKSDAEPIRTIEVKTQTVQKQTRVTTEILVGTIQSKTRTVLEAKVSGRIEASRAEPGRRFEEGEWVFKLDARETTAQLARAQATLDQAEADLRRYGELSDQGGVTPAEFDAVRSRHGVAEASVHELQAVLGQSQITAPFTGLVTRKIAEVGDMAGPGRALAEFEDSSRLRMEANLPEGLIGRVQLGSRLPVQVEALDLSLEGIVSEIAPAADPVSRTFLVALDLPATERLRSGLFARVAVPRQESAALSVPASAVVRRGQLELVFVLSEGVARMRLVTTGKSFGDEIELLSGLATGEQIVVEGADRLRDGQPVTVR